MYKIRLLVADYDTRYVDKFTEYISLACPLRFQVTSFTDTGLFEEYLAASASGTDILLADPRFLRQDPGTYNNVGLVLALTDGRVDTRAESYTTVSKYQPGEQIVNRLLELYSGQDAAGVKPVQGQFRTRLVSVYSPAGGAGKTSIAMGLAARMTAQGKKVLCLSLESINSMAAVLPGTGSGGLTPVLLALTGDKAKLPARVETSKTRDRVFNIEFFPAHDCFLELAEVNNQDLGYLLLTMKELGRYEAIIIDMDSAATGQAITVFDHCDRIIIVTVCEQVGLFKTRAFLDQMDRIPEHGGPGFLEKLLTVVNKWDPGAGFSPDRYGFREFFTVPFIRDLWTCEGDRCVFDHRAIFAGALTGLAKAVVKE